MQCKKEIFLFEILEAFTILRALSTITSSLSPVEIIVGSLHLSVSFNKKRFLISGEAIFKISHLFFFNNY